MWFYIETYGAKTQRASRGWAWSFVVLAGNDVTLNYGNKVHSHAGGIKHINFIIIKWGLPPSSPM